MIGNDGFVLLEATNRDGKNIRMGYAIPRRQFSPEELIDMEARAQTFVEEFGIRKLSTSKDWRPIFGCEGHPFSGPFNCMDHGERFLDYDGRPVYVSQPYFLDPSWTPLGKIDDTLRPFADSHNMEYIRRDDLSYHFPGRTKLLIWRRKRKGTVNQQEADIPQEGD